MDILDYNNKKEKKVLLTPTSEVDFKIIDRKKLKNLIKDMKTTMQEASGIGLAANQVGIDMNMFVAEVDEKFYAICNPEIIKKSEETSILEEGCLSVPSKFGDIKRSNVVTLKGFNQNGKRIKIKAGGLLAQVFQHEVDHLDGKLFIDRANNIREYPETKRLKGEEA